MDFKYTLSVLVILVAAATANVVNFNSQVEQAQPKIEGLGLDADVNNYVDDVIHMIVPFIKEHGLDPMPLPDLEEGFEVKWLLITYSARLGIHDGYMSGLVNVARSGDQSVHYFAKMMRVRVSLQFTNLEIFYRYVLKVMNIGPRGGIQASLNRFVVNVDLLFDFNNDEIHLQEFSLTDVGRLRARLTGNILYDWLVNPVLGVFTALFNNVIIGVVQSNINGAVQSAIALINGNIREIMGALESYN